MFVHFKTNNFYVVSNFAVCAKKLLYLENISRKLKRGNFPPPLPLFCPN